MVAKKNLQLFFKIFLYDIIIYIGGLHNYYIYIIIYIGISLTFNKTCFDPSRPRPLNTSIWEVVLLDQVDLADGIVPVMVLVDLVVVVIIDNFYFIIWVFDINFCIYIKLNYSLCFHMFFSIEFTNFSIKLWIWFLIDLHKKKLYGIVIDSWQYLFSKYQVLKTLKKLTIKLIWLLS